MNNILDYICCYYHNDNNEADKETLCNRFLITEPNVTGPTLTDVAKLILKLGKQISTLNLVVHCRSYNADITACAVCSEGIDLMAGTENNA
jgi:hypothetical protein